MSDQAQLISEDDELFPAQPENAKKNRGKAGAAIAAGVLVGVGGIAYDAYGSSISEELTGAGGKSTEKSSDATAVSNNAVQDSTQTHTQVETQPVHNAGSGNGDVTLLPDHINVGNAPDNMSFDEAFNLCRENLGPAAVFEWQGHLYHTCHPAEYAALPSEIKSAFDGLWFANEEHMGDFIPENDGEMYVLPMSYEKDATDTQVAHESAADSVVTNPEHETTSSADSTFSDATHADIVYSHDDFDSNFDGADEWINPEDVA